MGQEHQHPDPGGGQHGGAGLGHNRRPRRSDQPRAGARRLRAVPPVSGRVPHRRPGRPRGAGRPPVPGLAGPGRRGFRPRFPGRFRRPPVRVRRLPGGVPAQPGSPAPPAPSWARTGGRGPGCSNPGGPGLGAPAGGAGRRRRRAAEALRPVVHPPAPAPLPAPQRAGGAGQRRRSRRPPGPGGGGSDPGRPRSAGSGPRGVVRPPARARARITAGSRRPAGRSRAPPGRAGSGSCG